MPVHTRGVPVCLPACVYHAPSPSLRTADWIMHYSEFNIRCYMEVNWSYQSSGTFICGRLWKSFLKGKAVFGNQEWLAGEIGCGNYNYHFFIFRALPHSDDISIISLMLGINYYLSSGGCWWNAHSLWVRIYSKLRKSDVSIESNSHVPHVESQKQENMWVPMSCGAIQVW